MKAYAFCMTTVEREGFMTPERSHIIAGNIIRNVAKTLGDVFVPIIPAIVASGLLTGLTEGLNNALGGSLTTNSWWVLVHTFSNASFIFLQILIGYSAARIFGGNEFLGSVIGMVMNHPSLINAWNIPSAIQKFGSLAFQTVGSSSAGQWLTLATGTSYSAATATSDAIMSAGAVPQIALIPGVLNVTLQGYQGHVIPVVVAVWLMCRIERWLHESVPDMFDLFVTPLVTVLLTSLATMVVIGPAFSLLENLVLSFFRFLLSIPFGVGSALAGALYPLTVVLGVHHMFNALEASMCAMTPPYDNINPIISAANVAQGAACLGVFIKSASTKRKGIALPSGLSALMGITEPAIYGINLPSYRPFAAAVAGAAVGGALVSVLGVYSTTYGITGVFGYLITSDATSYSMVLGAAFLVSFAVTLLLYHDPVPASAPAATPADAEAAAESDTAADSDEAAKPRKDAGTKERKRPASKKTKRDAGDKAASAPKQADSSDPAEKQADAAESETAQPAADEATAPVDAQVEASDAPDSKDATATEAEATPDATPEDAATNTRNAEADADVAEQPAASEESSAATAQSHADGEERSSRTGRSPRRAGRAGYGRSQSRRGGYRGPRQRRTR